MKTQNRQGVVKREDMVVVSKCFNTHHVINGEDRLVIILDILDVYPYWCSYIVVNYGIHHKHHKHHKHNSSHSRGVVIP